MSDLSDQFERGGATSRIALTSVIADMQESRQAVQNAKVPECAMVAKINLVTAFNRMLDGFLAFAREEDDHTIKLEFTQAKDALAAANDAVIRLTYDALNP